MTKMVTAAQLKMLWSLARRQGIDSDLLHERARRLSGRSSLKQMTAAQAATLIDELQGKPMQSQARANNAQLAVIRALEAKLGWAEDPSRLRGWILSRYGVERLEWLKGDQAILCIEAMKGMLKGNRQERKTHSAVSG